MNTIVCSSLEEIRENIDTIDSRIVKLICEREQFVIQAASFKKSETDVKAPNRIEQVINKVKEIARNNNGNEIIVEKVYRTMIDAFVNREMKEFKDK